jgi:hypothetical protein
MIPKLMAAIVTGMLNMAAGVVVFFFMLLAMNGFSESDANYGIVVYIILAVIVTVLMAVSAVATVHVLLKRNWGAFGAAILGIVVFSGVGAGSKVVCSIIGVLVADLVRVNF